uniref:Uncharacterized protein n=1 Tax=Peronospora matthiolae TaxID=2874970 RepID=A0AAV1V7N1_9STRA
MSMVPRRGLSQDRDDPVETLYRLFVYSSTEPDTLRPVVRLVTFEHVVSPIQSKEQEVDYEVMVRDDVKMARWGYCSGNRTPSQASSVT